MTSAALVKKFLEMFLLVRFVLAEIITVICVVSPCVALNAGAKLTAQGEVVVGRQISKGTGKMRDT